MSRVCLPILLFVVAFSGTACSGPFLLLPGGELEGEVAPSPADWSFTDDISTIQIETNPSDPYSVNIWCAAAEGALYVAGSRASQWTRNIAADDRVTLRIGRDLYSLRATEATAEADIESFVSAAEAKYDFEFQPDQREESIVFRLEPR